MTDRPRRQPIVIDRVEQILDCYRLDAYCESCLHYAELDRHALVARYGPELLLDSVRERLRCSVCGSRKVTMHMSSPGSGGMADPMRGY